MRKIFAAMLLTLTACTVSGQYLTQSADGKSTILLPLRGMGAGVDIGKSEVTFGLNNYQKVLKDSAHFLLGANLSAKSAEGLASLFKAGEIVPQADFLGFAGLSFSNFRHLRALYKTSTLQQITDYNNAKQIELFESFKKTIIDEIVKAGFLSSDTSTVFANEIKKLVDDISPMVSGPEIRSYFTTYKPQQVELKKFSENIKIFFSVQLAIFQKKFADLAEIVQPKFNKAFDSFMDSLSPRRLTVFLQGGFSARSFKRYLGLNPTDLAKSFQDTLFRGGTFGFGLNAQIRNYWLGLTYSYLQGDNFISLTSKEYTLRNTDNSGNQSLIGEKKITAYPGTYGRVESNQLNIDLIGEYKMNDTSRLLINLYLRGSYFSRDTSLLKNYTNIGAGFYFIGKKSKFLGGLYIELPDVGNNLEKAKPAAEQNLRSPLKRLSFGIVTKFNISSLMSWSNRPAKPD